MFNFRSASVSSKIGRPGILDLVTAERELRRVSRLIWALTAMEPAFDSALYASKTAGSVAVPPSGEAAGTGRVCKRPSIMEAVIGQKPTGWKIQYYEVLHANMRLGTANLAPTILSMFNITAIPIQIRN